MQIIGIFVLLGKCKIIKALKLLFNNAVNNQDKVDGNAAESKVTTTEKSV